jgi:GH15 family glucan-1,4-alpha-glucosidase
VLAAFSPREISQNRNAEASALFERLLSVRNDVGLLAEEYDPHRQRQVGNFPQASRAVDGRRVI